MCDMLAESHWKTKEKYTPKEGEIVSFMCFNAIARDMDAMGWEFELHTNRYNNAKKLRISHQSKGIVGICKYNAGQKWHELSYLVHAKTERITVHKFLDEHRDEAPIISDDNVVAILKQCRDHFKAQVIPPEPDDSKILKVA